MQRRATGAAARPRRRRGGKKAGASSYHHGALREALLAAAEALLAEQGVERFTLRACARRAGVSHAAPAHHFGDVRGLLTAVATRSFERMVALMRRYREAAPDDAAAQFGAVGQAYLDYAVANRAPFRLMFRHELLDTDDAALQAAGEAAFEQLRETLTAFVRERGVKDPDLTARLLAAWSVVHGLATLLLENRLDGFRQGRSPAAFARAAGAEILRLLVTGLVSAKP